MGYMSGQVHILIIRRAGNATAKSANAPHPRRLQYARCHLISLRMKSKFLAALFGLSIAGAVRAEPIAIGVHAPTEKATNQEGRTVDLGELYKKGLVLVYFYPKADTPGCTAQACSLRDEFEKLTNKGVTVVGVSADGVEAQKAFQEKYQLPFVLLADSDKKVITAFGVPVGTMGFASRQAFLVKDGVVVWRDLKASTKQQAADVLAALDALKTTSGGA